MPDYDLGTARGRITIDGSGAEKGVSDAQQSVDKFTANAAKAGDSLKKTGVMFGTVGIAAVAGLGVAVKASADFEKKISGIAAVSGATEKELDKVRDKALKLGADTVFSAAESAGAMEELIKSGLTVDEVLNGAADATVALAAAGEIDLKDAATIASNAMNNFNLAAEDMPRIADLIAGAANASAIDVGEFGMALSQSGAVAKLAGLDFDDLSVAIAAMGNAGIRGSDAGTSLKTFLNNLQPTTEKQIELFEKLGLLQMKNGGSAKDYAAALEKQGKAGEKVSDAQERLNDITSKYNARGPARNEEERIRRAAEVREATEKLAEAQAEAKKINDTVAKGVGKASNAFYDQQGKLKPLNQIAQTLQESLKGMTDQEKQLALETMFGSDAIRAAAVVADNGAKGFDDLSKQMGKVKAADVAAKRLDNLSGDLEQLKGSVETALITTGSGLQDTLRGITQSITKLVNAFASLSPQTQGWITKAVMAVAAIGLLGGAFLYLVGTAFKFYVAMKRLNTAFQIVKGLKAVQGAMAALNATFLANPVFLVIAAIIALGIAVYVAYQKFKPFHDFVDSLWQSFQVGWDIVLNAVKGIGSAIYNFFRNLPATIGDFFKNLPRMLGFALGWILGTWIKFQVKMWTLIIKFGIGFLERLQKFLGELPGMAWRFFLLLIEKAMELRAWLMENGPQMALDFVNSLIDNIKKLPSLVGDIIGEVIKTIKDNIKKAFEAVKDFSGGLWDGFKEGLGIHSPSFIEKAMDQMTGNVSKNIGTLREDVKTMQGLANGIPNLAASTAASVGALRALGLITPQAADPTAGLDQALSSTVSFNVEKVVAQDPMEVMRKTEERKRLANIGGVGRIKYV